MVVVVKVRDEGNLESQMVKYIDGTRIGVAAEKAAGGRADT